MPSIIIPLAAFGWTSLGGRLDGWPVDGREGSLGEQAAAGGDVIGHHRQVIEAFPLRRQTARHGIVHVRLVDRLHKLDAHLPGLAREGKENAADALDVEVGFRELLEAELVAPDAERRLRVADHDANVTDTVEHPLSFATDGYGRAPGIDS